MSGALDTWGEAAPEPTSEADKQSARLFVCGHARDAEDAALLLDVLGLIP